MTNKELLNFIKSSKGHWTFETESGKKVSEEQVIKALEQQPSEDCISRQAVLDVINFEDKWLFDAKSHNADTHIAFSGLESRVKALPSVTPQRPKGKWIDIEIDAGEFIYKCSKCGMRVINPYKYCPICGAEMGGGEDEDGD